VHLAAVLCVVTAVAVVMAPAAIDRIREPNSVSSGEASVIAIAHARHDPAGR
jgi:hypothetical protein